MTHFTNSGSGKKRVSFAAPYPGQIIPIDMIGHGGTLLCQKDAFLCAAKGTKVSIAFTKRLGAGFFGGEGFILQKQDEWPQCTIPLDNSIRMFVKTQNAYRKCRLPGKGGLDDLEHRNAEKS
jgi:hypothetical protein